MAVNFKVSTVKVKQRPLTTTAPSLGDDDAGDAATRTHEYLDAYKPSIPQEERKLIIPLPSELDAALSADKEKQEGPGGDLGRIIERSKMTVQDSEDLAKVADADYDAVPVADYGLALLRGMGWQEGVPIGRNATRVVHCVAPVLRPKGMGLGAAPTKRKHDEQGQQGEEQEGANEVKKGALLKITTGVHRNAYGVAHSLDEDDARVIVKLALGGSHVTVSQHGVQVVSRREYDREAKCMNKDKVEQYKAERGDLIYQDEDSVMQAADAQKRPKVEQNGHAPLQPKSRRSCWLRPDLRVRIVDRKSPHFKAKAVVFDVPALYSCTCRTQDGTMLEDVTQEQVETVVPKSDSGHVLIIAGKYKGKYGAVMQRDVRRATASIQLLEDRDVLVSLSFDDICEFVGDVSMFDQ